MGIYFVLNIKEELGREWLPLIYKEKIRSQRTRAYDLQIDPRVHRVQILHTLLGIELKIGNKRIHCPDLATARYLQVFARFGSAKVAIPYDITKISILADELECSLQRILLILEEETKDGPLAIRGRLRGKLMKQLRDEISEIGAGDLMPEFRQSTKQRT
jgi:hypothetical protein